jgi:ABC-type sugar transport system substrate-binding protein
VAHKRRLVVMTIVLGMSVVAASSALGIARFTPGPVVATGELASVKPPWYVWNAKSCSFTTTTNHPATYVAKLRKISGFTLVYLPEGTGNPFDDALNAATKKAALQAGLKFYQFSNAAPSTTAPLTVVGQANTVHASSVIEANVIPQQYPAIQAAFKKACIPWLNEYNVPGSKNIPVFQTDNLGTGVGMATAAVPMMKARGWVADQTYIVTCADPSVGPNPGGVYGIDIGYRNTVAKLFPGSHIVKPDLACSGAKGIDGARSVMANWLTSHPDAKYVTAVSHIDSLYSLGMANALRTAGYGDRALVAGRGGDSSYIKLIAQGDPIVAVNGNPQFTHWGVPIVAMAEDIALGNPVPALVSPKLIVVTKANASQYGG